MRTIKVRTKCSANISHIREYNSC